MGELIPDMEWLYHVDLDLAKHPSDDDVARNARHALRIIREHQEIKAGDLLIIAVVRPRA